MNGKHLMLKYTKQTFNIIAFIFVPPNLQATFSSPGLPACLSVHPSVGINRDLLERLQLPVPDQERSSYSLVLVERLIRIMSQAAQPGNTHADVMNTFWPIDYNTYPHCVFMHISCVCACRRQSASSDPGADLSFIKAVCAVWKPLYNQRRSSGLSGGTVHTNMYTLLSYMHTGT